jgi:general secretion pathway protein L
LVNILKDIFSPRTVVGLQLDGRCVSAVQVSNPAGNPSVDHMARQEIGKNEDFAEALRNFWEREKFRAEVVVTSIPTSLAVIREISLPVKNLKKLDKIVKYQMEPYVPYPIDEIVVNFFPPRPDHSITLTGVRKASLSEHLDALSRSGIAPAMVTLEDAALFFLYVHANPAKNDTPAAIVHLKSEETVVHVIHQRRLTFMRSLQGGADDLRSLKETLAVYQMKYPGEPVSEVLITGTVASDASLVERIEAMTGIQTSLWLPFDHFKNGKADIAAELQAGMSVPLGLAMGPTNASSGVLDFRKEEFRLKTAFDLKNMAIYSLTAILILLGLFTFSVYRRLSTTETAYETLNRQMTRVLIETFPQNRTVIKGRELAQMKQQIDAGKNSYRWLEEITASEPVLEILLVLTNTLAGYREAKIDNISIEGARILLDGRAPSFKTVDDLKNKLEQVGYFKTTRLMGAKMDSQDSMIRFSFHLEKKSEAQKT